MDEISERQESEFEVLKSIYDEDIFDLRSRDVWNQLYRPPEFTIKLKPNHDSQGILKQDCCYCLLKISFTPQYPLKSCPKIGVESTFGIEDPNDLDKLEKCIEETLINQEKILRENECGGAEMIYDLTQKVSEFLRNVEKHRLNKLTSLSSKDKYHSFYDEMEARHREAQAENERKKQKELELIENQRKIIQQQVYEATQALKEKKLLKKEELRKRAAAIDEEMTPPSNANEVPNINRRRKSSRRNSTAPNPYDEKEEEGESGTQRLSFYNKESTIEVDKLSIMGKNPSNGCIVYNGVIVNTGQLVTIKKWVFKTHSTGKKVSFSDTAECYDEKILMKQLQSIEQELSSIQKVVGKDDTHVGAAGIANYYGMTINNDTKKEIVVYLFEEFIRGANFNIFLSDNIPCPLKILRHYSKIILESIDYMHQKNFVHRNLRDTCIFIQSDGSVIITDWSIDKRIRDLIISQQNSLLLNNSERFPLAIGRGGKKVDIYRLGLLILSLYKGYICHDFDNLLKEISDPDFSEFLKKCLNKDERERWSASELLSSDKFLLTEESEIKDENFGSPVDRSSSPEDNEVGKVLDFISLNNANHGGSRLNDEFSFISQIGKGGFGEVIKVKNKLDGQTYAIKKIKLNPNNKQVTKKIMREVKLLSKLNHENVVRYYNSWLETATLDDESSSRETSELDITTGSNVGNLKDSSFEFVVPKTPVKNKDDLNKINDLSLSYSSYQNFPEEEDNDEDEEDSDDDDDYSSSEFDEDIDEDIFGTSFLPRIQTPDDTNGSIVFEKDSIIDDIFEDDNNKSDSKHLNQWDENKKKRVFSQFLYIQMELCDKQTLKNAIDNNLYKDLKRKWRMFRELIEGLVHIHTQGMIHRDLKPMNIFIDSQDHVKIGDFGLATTSMAIKEIANCKIDLNESSFLNDSNSSIDLTGQIGTALYTAPEINIRQSSSYCYTQKVDIYSLGIIFFEMCTPPLMTGMERIKILTDLRSESIIFPQNFDCHSMILEHKILTWLLSHNPSKRPTSNELLISDYLPPPQVEEAKLKEMIRHSLSNNKSKSYHHLINACLSQRMSLPDDLKYDSELAPRIPIQRRKKILINQEFVREIARSVFRRHGAVHVNAPMLLPKGKSLGDCRENLVILMTRNGETVSLPYDLRLPFARYIARTNINNLKRYCIAPVYREELVFGVHPKELIECAFDIVTPNEGNLLSDAEILAVADEILRECNEKHYFIRLNHSLLLEGIFENFGINITGDNDAIYDAIYQLLKSGGCKKNQSSKLLTLGLSHSNANSLIKLLDLEGSLSEVQFHFRHIIKRKNNSASIIHKAFRELEEIVKHAINLGVKSNIVIAPSLIYNHGHFSGMFCHVVREKKKNKKSSKIHYEVVAAGGRYDLLLNGFQSNMSLTSRSVEPINQSAVGISLSLDVTSSNIDEHCNYSACDVIIYSMNHINLTKEKCELAKTLISFKNYKIYLCDGLNLSEVEELSVELNASIIFIIRDNCAGEEIWARIRDKEDRFIERKLNFSEVKEFMTKQFNTSNTDYSLSEDSLGYANNNLGISNNPTLNVTSPINSNSSSSSSSIAIYNFNSKFLDTKKNSYNSVQKKRLETSIYSRLQNTLSVFNSNTRVEVIILNFPMIIIKSLVAFLDFDSDENAFQNSVESILQKHSRYRKDLLKICDEISDLKFQKKNDVLVLYSLDEHNHKIIIFP